MRPIFFKYGPISITWYMAFGVILTIVGYIMLKLLAKDNKYKKELEDYYFIELIAGFIGSRLVYVLFNFSLYKGNLFDAIRINHYNLNLIGGVMIALLVLYIGTKFKKLPFFQILNPLLIPFYFSMAVGVWAFEFEGILSSVSQVQTVSFSILFILALILHSLTVEKFKKSGLVILFISMIGYYGISIFY
ncbi:prolipoprotein diacylglyceryl transferase [Clostridium sp. D2Q-11]|uniref:Prolipoprotein diacylglyceryl transferase n=1 Tax=Anaeromonas frigoriresistens TaxID=2683708 RepID=A0A942UUH1_9FIRM|nr:prolipoprotein diacylglyceryl transferase family protein [Anaeromonas frigoriresistens]MBS4537056.1 prolipoprotein diacylglyceryl transferase [Anaeromonas frigoriresistens]